jgi:hypothetical protein
MNKAVEITVDSPPEWLSHLSTAYLCRFDSLGVPSDLDDSISIVHKAADLSTNAPSSDPTIPTVLGLGYLRHYEQSHALADIEISLSNLQKAIDIAPDNHPDGAMHLSNRSLALRIRFDNLRNISDIDAAIEDAQKAVRLKSDVHPDKINYLAMTAAKRRQRHGRVDHGTGGHENEVCRGTTLRATKVKKVGVICVVSRTALSP